MRGMDVAMLIVVQLHWSRAMKLSSSLLFSTFLAIAGAASAVSFFVMSIATTVHAQPRQLLLKFVDADKDHDNQLDLQEAKAAFPLLDLVDDNKDGLLSTREAEKALPGLSYDRDKHEDVGAVIGEAEYDMLAQQYALSVQNLREGKLVTPLESKDGEVKNDAQTDD